VTGTQGAPFFEHAVLGAGPAKRANAFSPHERRPCLFGCPTNSEPLFAGSASFWRCNRRIAYFRKGISDQMTVAPETHFKTIVFRPRRI
jgi:hypothetical protein